MIAIYAAKNRDIVTRRESSSGGVFMALCASTVNRGGVVYGARYDEDMRVVHGRAISYDECRLFSGSKYVQSDLGTCLSQVLADLRAGLAVLFSGTPCQVAGLLSYLSLNRTTGDLLTVEVICHGVPSPRLWADHVSFIQMRSRRRLVDYRFRDKSQGWHHSRHQAILETKALSDSGVNAFHEVFSLNYALRPSCHECPFASLERVADLTLGDYWGVENHFPEFDDDVGVSLILVNTEVGRLAFELIRSGLDSFKVSLDECIQSTPNLVQPTPPSPQRVAFWRRYSRVGYDRTIRYYTSYGVARRVLRGARRAARRMLT